MAILLSALDIALSATFATLVARQWLVRRKPYQLLWSIALLVWVIAVTSETAAALQGKWLPTSYRFYYAFGALMVAPWLGAGSLFLVASKRLARGYLAFVVLLSLIGMALIFAFPVDPSSLARTDALGFVEVKIFPFVPIRMLIVLGNILGTLAFVGSALYSLWKLWRKDSSAQRTGGLLLIGVGGLIAAMAHSIGVLGGPGLFRASELLAIAVILGGYLLSTRPGWNSVRVPQTVGN